MHTPKTGPNLFENVVDEWTTTLTGFANTVCRPSSRMDLSPQTHDVLAATILALVSVFALVLVLSGLRRRGGKFRVSVRYGKAQ